MPVKALGNISVTYGGIDITQYLNQASLEAIVNEIDTTNLASTAMEKTPGASGWSIPVAGFWALALDNVMGPDAVTPPGTLEDLAVAIGASGAVATYTWTANAFVGQYKVDASNPTGMITWSGNLAVSGPPVRTTS